MNDEQRKEWVAALLEERRGYVTHGLDERVAEVDAVLARLGAEGVAPAKRATRRKAAKS